MMNRPRSFIISMFFSGLLLMAALVRPAWAKKVAIEWSPIVGASKYELEVTREGKVLLKKQLDESSWKGELKFGIYSYQVRAYDRIHRAGQWTEAMPLVVMPLPPELQGPDDGKKVMLYSKNASATLKWAPVAGASKYRVELTRKGGGAQVLLMNEPSLKLRDLEPGDYSWKVTAIVKPKGRAPASFEAKQWESKPSDVAEFKVERQQLAAPLLSYPRGILLPPGDGKQNFKWKKVDGAERYELQVFAKTPKPLTTINTQENSAVVNLPAQGKYTWKVRALANIDDKSFAEASGPQSTAEFKLDKDAAFLEGSGYVALSTMIAPYNYQVISPAAGLNGTAASSALTGRLSAEYWFKPQWGIGTAFEMTSFQIASQSFTRKGYELTARYRFNFGGGRYNWSFSPKAGIEARDYFEIFPPGAPLSTFNSNTYGAQLGADLRKAFNDRFSVGIKVAYYKPLILSSSSAGSLTSDASQRNISVGAQLLYWLTPHWGVGAGGFIEKRSISYKLQSPPAGTNSSEQVFMDGSYFFGSLIFSFGR